MASDGSVLVFFSLSVLCLTTGGFRFMFVLTTGCLFSSLGVFFSSLCFFPHWVFFSPSSLGVFSSRSVALRSFVSVHSFSFRSFFFHCLIVGFSHSR